MGHHRAQAQFERAKWRPTILYAIWIFQILIMIILAGLFGHRLSDTLKWDDPDVYIVWEAINIALPGIGFILTAYEIYRYFRQTLTPWTMLFTNIIKWTCATGALVLDIYVYSVKHPGYYYAVSGLILDSLFIVYTLVPAIYSIRTYKRSSNFDEYRMSGNTKPFGFAKQPTDLESQYRSSGSFVEHPQPQPDPGHRRNVSSVISLSTRRSSAASSVRSVSAATTTTTDSDVSRLSSTETPESAATSISNGVVGHKPVSLPTPIQSYRHERDTQFEEYVAQRSSQILQQQLQQQQTPVKSPRRSPLTSLTPISPMAVEDKVLRSPTASPPGRIIVPSVVVSPASSSGIRRVSAGLDVVIEEVELNKTEEEEEEGAEKKGLLTGKAESEIQVAKTRKQPIENVELLREVDLITEDIAKSKKRSWGGAVV